MNKILLIFISVLFVSAAPADQWQVYKNQKYKYEIQYPDSFEFRPTGKKTERDGKTFLLALKNISVLHGINGTIYPGMSLQEIAKNKNAPALNELDQGPVIQNTTYHKLVWSKTTVNGKPAIRMAARFNETDELFMMDIIMNNIEFTSVFWGACDESTTEDIISTFKFSK